MGDETLTEDQLRELYGVSDLNELAGLVGGAEGLGGLLGSFFTGGTADSLLGAGLGYSLFDGLSSLGKTAQEESLKIGETAKKDAAFTPFTVSTGFGNVDTTPEGGFTTTLSPYGEQFRTDARGITSGLMGDFGAGMPDVSGITSAAFGGIPGLLQAATGDTATREADIYNRLRATQTPEEERQALALEQRLASQGRTGLRTAQFGGSPEQLAMAKAREEAMLSASLGSMDQARAEQLQQLGMAQGLFGLGAGAASLPSSLVGAELGNIGASLGLSYMPEQQLLSTLNPATNLASIASLGQREGAALRGEAAMTGLEGRIAAEDARTEALASIYSALFNNAGAGDGGATGSDGLLSALANLF